MCVCVVGGGGWEVGAGGGAGGGWYERYEHESCRIFYT